MKSMSHHTTISGTFIDACDVIKHDNTTPISSFCTALTPSLQMPLKMTLISNKLKIPFWKYTCKIIHTVNNKQWSSSKYYNFIGHLCLGKKTQFCNLKIYEAINVTDNEAKIWEPCFGQERNTAIEMKNCQRI